MVKDVGNLVRVQVPVTRARETLWPPAREGHEPGEAGGSPCPLAEPGARPSRHCEAHWSGRRAGTRDADSLRGMAAKVTLAFQSLLPAVCMCIGLHGLWKGRHSVEQVFRHRPPQVHALTICLHGRPESWQYGVGGCNKMNVFA